MKPNRAYTLDISFDIHVTLDLPVIILNYRVLII